MSSDDDVPADSAQCANLVDHDAAFGFERCIAMLATTHDDQRGQREVAVEIIETLAEDSRNVPWLMHALAELSFRTDDLLLALTCLHLMKQMALLHRDARDAMVHSLPWLVAHLDHPRPGPHGTACLTTLVAVVPLLLDPTGSNRRASKSVMAAIVRLVNDAAQDDVRWAAGLNMLSRTDFFLRQYLDRGIEDYMAPIVAALEVERQETCRTHPLAAEAAASCAFRMITAFEEQTDVQLIMVKALVPALVAAACYCYPASEALGSMMDDSSCECIKPYAKSVCTGVLDRLMAAAPGELVEREAVNALWVLSVALKTFPSVGLKNKKLADDLFAYCMDGVAKFMPQMLSVATSAELSKLEQTQSTLHCLDQLSLANSGNANFVKKLKKAVLAAAAPDKSWESHAAAVAVLMYGAEGCKESLSQDMQIAQMLGHLLADPHPVVRMYALRAATEAPVELTMSAVPVLLRTLSADIGNTIPLIQGNAVEMVAWLAGLTAGALADIEGDANKANDSEDDAIDYGDDILTSAAKAAVVASLPHWAAHVHDLIGALIGIVDNTPFPFLWAHALRCIASLVALPCVAVPDRDLVLGSLVRRLEDEGTTKPSPAAMQAKLRACDDKPCELTPARLLEIASSKALETVRLHLIEAIVAALKANRAAARAGVAAVAEHHIAAVASYLRRLVDDGLHDRERLTIGVVYAYGELLDVFDEATQLQQLPVAVRLAIGTARAQLPPPMDLADLDPAEVTDDMERMELVVNGAPRTFVMPPSHGMVSKLIEASVDLLLRIVQHSNKAHSAAIDRVLQPYLMDLYSASAAASALNEDTQRAARYLGDPLVTLAQRVQTPQQFACFVFKIIETTFNNAPESLDVCSYIMQTTHRMLDMYCTVGGPDGPLRFFEAGDSNIARFTAVARSICQMVHNCISEYMTLMSVAEARKRRLDRRDTDENAQDTTPNAAAGPERREDYSDEDDDVVIDKEELKRDLHNVDIIVNHAPAALGFLLRISEQWRWLAETRDAFEDAVRFGQTPRSALSRLTSDFSLFDRPAQEEIRPATIASLNAAWWLVKAFHPVWNDSRPLIQHVVLLTKRELERWILPFVDLENAQTTFSLWAECVLRFIGLRRVGLDGPAPEKALEELNGLLPIEDVTLFCGFAAQFLRDPRSKRNGAPKNSGAGATNAISFVTAVMDYSPESIMTVFGDVASFVDLVAAHVPLCGDKDEALTVYQRLAQWRGNAEHPSHAAGPEAWSRLQAALRRSKHAKGSIAVDSVTLVRPRETAELEPSARRHRTEGAAP